MAFVALSGVPASAVVDPAALDTSFGSGGRYSVDLNGAGDPDDSAGVAVQTDDKVLVGGNSFDDVNQHGAVARLTSSGALDTSYDSTAAIPGEHKLLSSVDTSVIDLAVGASNVSYAVGQTRSGGSSGPRVGFIAKVDSSGHDVTAFNTTGSQTNSSVSAYTKVLVQGSNVLAIGEASNDPTKVIVTRYNGTTGALDTSWGTGGTVTITAGTNFSADDAVVAGSQVWLLGEDQTGPLVVRMNGTDGSTQTQPIQRLTGFIPSPYPQSITADGSNVVIAGNGADGHLAFTRLDTTGTPDPTFGHGGYVTVPYQGSSLGLLRQSDGRFVAQAGVESTEDNGGESGFTTVRISNYGAVDKSYGDSGVSTTTYGSIGSFGHGIAQDSSGHIISAGSTDLDSDGNTDTAVIRLNGTGANLNSIPQSPSAVTATDLQNGGATIGWTAGATGNGTITSSTVTAIPEAGSGAPVLSQTLTGSGTTLTPFTGLTTGVHYTFSVHQNNAVGAGFESPVSASTLITGPPNPPYAAAAIGKNGGTVHVQWDAPVRDGGSPVTGYTLTYADGSAVTGGASLPSTARSLDVTGLNSTSSYQFKVTATNVRGTSIAATTNSTLSVGANADTGYYLIGADGKVLNYGSVPPLGDFSSSMLNKPVVGSAISPTGSGFWLVASDGGILTKGDAQFYGSLGGTRLNKPVVGMAATPTGHGYTIAATDGGIFTFGDARFYGSEGSVVLNKPVVGMSSSPSGGGYWMVASDGGIFTHGDAGFYGSEGSVVLNKPIVAMAPTPSGKGYWLVASDGGVFTHGDAGFYGSLGGVTLNKPITSITASPSGHGYVLTAADGGTFNFGDGIQHGSAGGSGLTQPVVGIIHN